MTKRLIVMVGPTAAGKTARALELAPRVGGEVISADSRHVYTRMDIGTNKPTAEERAAVPHHLLNLREPHEGFSLAEYVRLARAAIAEVQSRGKTPMLVGGTGQYVRALLEGWQVPEVPPNEAIREKWLSYEKQHGQEALFAELIARDPQSAESIDRRNVRRVVRALEVMDATGQIWSALQRRQPLEMEVQMHYVNLKREELYARADARIAKMIEMGWLRECDALLAFLESKGFGYEAAMKLPALSSLGYRELCAVVHGSVGMGLDAAVAQIKHETRRFIRMQDTWFRKDVKQDDM
jgi:tRNA dimethylallyltransferase